jgi:scyllo-inositol 2-dehydrogenase (NADP+)
MKKIRTALVGFGSVGEKIHAPLISHNENFELVAVVERTQEKSKAKYPEIDIFRTFEGLLEEGNIELAVIVTPNEFHFDQARKCLEKGIHVVVDKPVTLRSDEAILLKDLAKEKGLCLSVFQNRRLDGDFITVKKLLANGTLGRIVHFESHFDRFRPHLVDNWREKNVPGNGITYDLGTHLIDQVVVLFGKPDWVNAEILVQRTGAVADDFFDISLGYPGLKVRLTASVLSNVPMQRFMVLGERGSYLKFGLDVQEKAFKAGLPPEGQDWGKEDPEAWGKLYLEDQIQSLETERGDYRLFYQNIAEAISKRGELAVTMEEAITVLEVIEAAFKSQKEGMRIFFNSC